MARKMIPVPVERHERISALRDHYTVALQSGRTKRVVMTDQGDASTVPLHQIIEIAIAEVESHLERGRRAR